MTNASMIVKNKFEEDEMQTFIETVRNLPQNYRDMLIGAAYALEMSAGIDEDKSPALSTGVIKVAI